MYISTPLNSCPYKSSATCAWSMARVAEKTCLNICANSKGADQPASPRRLISAFVVRCSSFFSTKKRLTNLNGEQNDTWNLLVSHRFCHFRAIQPFDLNWCDCLNKLSHTSSPICKRVHSKMKEFALSAVSALIYIVSHVFRSCSSICSYFAHPLAHLSLSLCLRVSLQNDTHKKWCVIKEYLWSRCPRFLSG